MVGLAEPGQHNQINAVINKCLRRQREVFPVWRLPAGKIDGLQNNTRR